MQGPAGMAGWRVQRGGEGMCECVKYCTETPPAAANVCGVKGASWEQLWGDKEVQQAAVHAGRARCGMARCDTLYNV